jgi:DNA-binding response OmpR family regulator
MNQQYQLSAPEIRVIIVDGDSDFREATVESMKLQGYTITGFGSAGDFYQQLFSGRCDLAIIDIGLEGQSGLVLAEYVRKNTDARIIMLSSRPDVEVRLAGYASGADVCLVKPVDGRELLALITNMFDRLDAAKHHVEPPPTIGETTPGELSMTWKLFRNDWSLQTPNGESIALTAKEYDFMLSLVLQSSAIVTRQYILKILGYQPNEQGNRALESLIYRLRRKTESLGYGFPIKTYRGIGYCLASPILLA